jgi:3-hydroxybutyryl-CoA dehydrogenase
VGDIDAILARIRVAASLDEARDADFVFECCVDDPWVKKKVFGRLDEICPKTTVLATNTMNISLSEVRKGREEGGAEGVRDGKSD